MGRNRLTRMRDFRLGFPVSAHIRIFHYFLKGILFFFLFPCFPYPLAAQDDHYWSQQYGAVSTLMGGAIVGGADDNSAVYYNPGALAFISNTSLSVDANVYKMDKIRIHDGAGNNVNLNSAQLSVYPQIIAGMINIFKESRFRFSYTVLTRNHGNILMNSRYTSQTTPGNPGPPVTSFVGVFDYVNQLNEQWFGMGIGYALCEKFGVGATFLSSYRGQSYQLTNYVQEVENADSGQVFRTQTNDEAIKYGTFRLLVKFGMSYRVNPWKFGITITTPSVGLFGNGSVQRQNSVITVSDIPADMKNNFLIMDRRSGVKSTYKHPLSIAFGIDYQTEKAHMGISAEYFFKIGPYAQISPNADPFVYPSSYLDSARVQPLTDNYLLVNAAARPVLNIGIGFSHLLYKQLTLIAGAHTDFASYQPSGKTRDLMHGFENFDIYHFSTGLSYKRLKQTLSLGFTYSFSPDRKVKPYAVINQDPVASDKAMLSSNSFSIVLGYTYYFAKFSE